MELKLSLESSDRNHNVLRGVVSTVRRVADQDGNLSTDNWSWTGSVPISVSEAKIVEIPQPGIYQVEAVLPSGQLLSRQINISDGETREIKFHPVVPVNTSRDGVATPKSSGAPRFHIAQTADNYFLKGAPSRARAKKISTAVDAGDHVLLLKVSDPVGPLWHDLIQLGNSFGPKPKDARETITKTYVNVNTDPGLRAVPSTHAKTWLIEGNLHREGERIFAAVHFGDRMNLVSLPYSFVRSGSAPPSTIEFLTLGSKSEFCVTVVLRDEILDGLLAYLNTRNLDAAATILKELRSDPQWVSLASHSRSPLATTIAAYVLSAEDALEPEANWGSTWSPDRLILRARNRLRHAENENDLNEAKLGFVEAYNAGLPYFSAGVEYLAEGLSMFSTDDEKIGSMARDVSAARSRIDPSQAFTVVKLG